MNQSRRLPLLYLASIASSIEMAILLFEDQGLLGELRWSVLPCYTLFLTGACIQTGPVPLIWTASVHSSHHFSLSGSRAEDDQGQHNRWKYKIPKTLPSSAGHVSTALTGFDLQRGNSEGQEGLPEVDESYVSSGWFWRVKDALLQHGSLL